MFVTNGFVVIGIGVSPFLFSVPTLSPGTARAALVDGPTAGKGVRSAGLFGEQDAVDRSKKKDASKHFHYDTTSITARPLSL